MPTRRQIREAVVQFLYCSDLEGGADPASLREPFWQFVTESDRRALVIATWKTIHHLSIGRENRHVEFLKRLTPLAAFLKTDPELESLAERLEGIASLEDDWTSQHILISRIPSDDHDDSVSARFEPSIQKLFRIDHDLSAARKRFVEMIEDYPQLRSKLEPVVGSIRRLERISERLRMIEEPERFPESSELDKIRESRESLQTLRREADQLTDSILTKKEDIDEQLNEVIENFAPERIDPIDRAILRLATWEILYNPEVPAPVAINEAIELAKKFGTSDSARFVNGILDQIAKNTHEPSSQAESCRSESQNTSSTVKE